ncbi:hypothetical protein PISMIDRAFT_18796 [Pisolithus microcarpus 441]|uniref:Unplaced genomic scaffold scaffold_406, whole genome shotgun sequence n=1 Tax=Pisolithus microcarpus 441 TaxID=765257 RepID=A0A0C9YWU4_9AGAM|nr:hypothetical protein PISMIDRAFT_18796 [Pisolithus microcarpus 441]
MSNPPDSPTFALPPFDHVKADVILRSSDGVDFRVFRLFLSLASPFFETLFDLPQPSEAANADMEIEDGLPVIPVSEGSKTLDSLLRFCYPCTLAEDPVIEDFREIINVLEAAKKYSLDAIQPAICKSLFTPKILEANSLRCFAIACRALPEWFEEIELITSTELLSLLTYHRKCSEAVQSFKGNLSWIPNELTPGHDGSCQCSPPPYASSPLDLGDWWKGFMDSTFLVLSDSPCTETIKASVEKMIQTVRQRGCNRCRDVAPGRLRELDVILRNKVEEATSKIKLDLNY